MTELDSYLRPRESGNRFWLIPIAFVALAASLVFLCQRDTARLDRLKVSNQVLAKAQAIAVKANAAPADSALHKRWADLKAERDFPWEIVFHSVERADRTSIELLEFRPDKLNRRIILRGEAQDPDALVAYLEALAAQPAFVQVHLLHLRALSRDKLATIGFEIKATIR